MVEAVRDPRDEPLFAEAPRLRRRGSISRGIVAGNRRDVSIESGLRMELSGEIADGVEVQAVLTDENTPIQPEGTTQRLSDFDRVYVQLDTRRGQARLGDIDLAFTGTEFAPYVRKLQGAAVTARAPALGGVFAGGEATVAGATARGLFQSQDLLAVEGVQGPYRLEGRDGERFIIVIAGSERVYLNGLLLTRGEAADYVIDYATGEITFSPRRLVTSESRITVDFEYTTSEFTRTVIGTEAEARLWPRADGTARARIRGTLLREADGAAFADELGLTEADLDLIAASGDAPAVRDGAERVPFDPESPFVLYTRRDTLFAGQTYSIFVPATAAADSVYPRPLLARHARQRHVPARRPRRQRHPLRVGRPDGRRLRPAPHPPEARAPAGPRPHGERRDPAPARTLRRARALHERPEPAERRGHRERRRRGVLRRAAPPADAARVRRAASSGGSRPRSSGAYKARRVPPVQPDSARRVQPEVERVAGGRGLRRARHARRGDGRGVRPARPRASVRSCRPRPGRSRSATSSAGSAARSTSPSARTGCRDSRTGST